MGFFGFGTNKKRYSIPNGQTAKEYAKDVIALAKKYANDINQSTDPIDFSVSYSLLMDTFDEMIWLNEKKKVWMYPDARKNRDETIENMDATVASFIKRSSRDLFSRYRSENLSFEIEFLIDSIEGDSVISEFVGSKSLCEISNLRNETKKLMNEIEVARKKELLSNVGKKPHLELYDIDEFEVILALEKRVDCIYRNFVLSGMSPEIGLSELQFFKENCESSFFPLAAEIRLESLLEQYEPKFSEGSMLHHIDSMSGEEFEYWCANILLKNGFYSAEVTQGSGDHGVDVVAVKDDVRYAIQCKCYHSDLGNSPVQEVYAGKEMYGCQVGAVMTNRRFTKGAKALAEKTRVLLWDREQLIALIESAK